MSEADYQQWRQHPVTRWFRNFLTAFADDVVAQHNERWANGNDQPQIEALERGRFLAAIHFRDLTFEDVAQAYHAQTQEPDAE